MEIIEESKNVGSAVLYGTIAIFILVIVSSFLFSSLLRFTSLQESSYNGSSRHFPLFPFLQAVLFQAAKGRKKAGFLEA